MELDIETKQHLTDLLVKPILVSDAHVNLLTDLVKTYPYYQPLHLLLAKANLTKPNFKQLLTSASLYNGGHLTYQIINKPEIFGNHETTLDDEISISNISDEQETFEEINELEPASFKEQQAEEQEGVFEEIAEVDTIAFTHVPTKIDEVEAVKEESATVPNELAIENIVASDFFAFEQNFSTESVSNETLIVTQPEEYNQEAEAQSTVSKYDDDKLPYTFLWWLAKTRKEHEQIFQPYVTPKQPSSIQQGELQHQYVEHIFHLQTPFNVADEVNKGPLNFHTKPRGIDIIDSFIKNDPQIKAPKPEQINTENKAKKSAEDNYDLVSETLAAIYIEQMLYHKAIDTYEKLSLKFPEKSRYFADLIQSLEKKI